LAVEQLDVDVRLLFDQQSHETRLRVLARGVERREISTVARL
jgi:hypothetical protein